MPDRLWSIQISFGSPCKTPREKGYSFGRKPSIAFQDKISEMRKSKLYPQIQLCSTDEQILDKTQYNEKHNSTGNVKNVCYW